MACLTPFEIGQIKAHLHLDLGPIAIAKLVQKSDGDFVTKQAVIDVAARLENVTLGAWPEEITTERNVSTHTRALHLRLSP